MADAVPAPVRRIAIVAGEASGDLLGSLLVRALRARHPHLDVYGIAGPRMQAEGVHSLYPMETLSVRGYLEALTGLPAILRIRRQLRAHLLAQPPDLFIGIDAPDFNLSLEATLRAAGLRTVHFVSPSIWAWRPERMALIRRAVDHMLLIFPFEAELYRRAGVPATYVGHPLAQAFPATPDRAGARQRLGLDAQARVVALLPGSRASEIRALAPLYARTAARLLARHADLHFLVPMVRPEQRALFEASAARAGLAIERLDFRPGQAHDILQAADAALIASGTATLEALLLDCPHVITYLVPRFSFWLMQRTACSDMVGLPNILAGRHIVPEMIQEKARPDLLADAVDRLLVDADAAGAMRAAFAPIRASLRRDTQSAVAEALAPFLA